MEQTILEIVVDTPLDASFDYRWAPAADAKESVAEAEQVPAIGQLVRVEFGKRETIGLVVGHKHHSELAPDKLKTALSARTQLPPLSARWLELCRFAADYYQRPLGEVALPALPKNARALTTVALDKALKKLRASAVNHVLRPQGERQLNPQQAAVLAELTACSGFQSCLLHGVTGSGKTEVYLQLAARTLAKARDAGRNAQVLILVPEINLTPQLEQRVAERFPALQIATLHSGLSEGERLRHWLMAHQGQAAIVLGTRLAVMASLPDLALIIVDEEHDPSYKQQEGLRYSARDLAIWRARQHDIPILLASATPSLETWQHAQSGRYRLLTLSRRAADDAQLPAVRTIDTEREKAEHGLTPSVLSAIRQRLACGEQSLLYLNRRGYAPVLSCDACGWLSNCPHCSAYMVLHKPEHRLRCHHCSLTVRIPRACPTCGNVDIHALGRGTQRIEEHMQTLFPEARILRIDADSTRHKGSAQSAFEAVHQREVDILIGTQMVAKGHDFQHLTLVAVVNPDTALFSHDYRASERLFAQLMQVSGRAGRGALKEGGCPSEVLIQTRYPNHPLYLALKQHDYAGFATALLDERRQAQMPPFIYHAMLRAEARNIDHALAYLTAAAALIEHDEVTVNDPIPMSLTRVAKVERAQLLLESSSRQALQASLKRWMQRLRSDRELNRGIKWSLEVDPSEI